MSKRLRVEDDFNPVYPYGYARNQNIPFLTPPFVSSDGFQNFPPGVLSLKLADPITINNGDVSLKVGGGLTVEQQSGNLTIDAKAPLQVANGKLDIALAPPFEVKDNKLSLLVGNGLKVIDRSVSDLPGLLNYLVVLTGKGIGNEEIKNADGTNKGVGLRVRIAEAGGLTFDDKGELVAWYKNNDKRTLWTTLDPSPNCRVDEEKDSKFTLVLTKCGSQILASVSLLIVKGKFQILDHKANTGLSKAFAIKLLFDENGVLKDSSNIDKNSWNYRSGNSVLSEPYKNAIGFMPNLAAYPKSTTSGSKIYARNTIFGNIYLDSQAYNPVVIKITFNQEADSAYSMTFNYSWTKDYEKVPFDSTSFTFCYIAQE
ncbi:fiber [Human adenovirus 71]|uniref:Fiber n=1 Tax=Human adenovirus 71 TaxID=1643649 RepID=T1UHQ0_9ADEN|nr:fiber [Human adenovirus 71]